MRKPFSSHRFRSAQGMALPLTLAVMLSLTTSVTSVVQFSSANARTASVGASDQNAASVAEDGFKRVLSIIATNPTVAGPATGSATDTRTAAA